MMRLFQYTPSIVASALILILFYLLFLIFKPFIAALMFSWVMVILFYPIHVRIAHKLPNGWASLASTLLVFIIIIIPGLLITAGVVYEIIGLSQGISSVSIEKAMTYAHTTAAKFNVDLNEVIKNIASRAGQLALSVIENAWNIVIGIVVTFIATFFFFKDGKNVKKHIKALPINSAWTEHLIDDITTMTKANIAASFVAASLQGLIGGLAFAWCGLPAPLLWGTVMGLFSIFPIIGSWLVWVPAAAALALMGDLQNALFLVIIGVAVVNPIDNLVRPAIIGKAIQLNTLLIFIAILGGVYAFGVSGILIGPIIVVLVASLLTNSDNKKFTHSM